MHSIFENVFIFFQWIIVLSQEWVQVIRGVIFTVILQVISTYSPYCTRVVCRHSRVKLESLPNCQCSEVAARVDSLPFTPKAFEETSSENETIVDLVPDAPEFRYFFSQPGLGKDKTQVGTMGGEKGSNIPEGGIVIPHVPAPESFGKFPSPIKPLKNPKQSSISNNKPGRTHQRYTHKRFRCRLNGWYPRITDGALQEIKTNCVRLACVRNDGNVKPSLKVQAKIGCLCESKGKQQLPDNHSI